MRISTNTASCMTSYGKKGLITDLEAIRKLQEAGFDTIDISFVFPTYPEFILRADDWKDRIEHLAEEIRTLGVTLNQCHLPFGNTWEKGFRSNGFGEIFDECTRRGIIAAGILKIPNAVIHPMTFPELNNEGKACMEANHAYYDEFVELAVKHNVRLVYENMPPFANHDQMAMRYCQHYEQLAELVDSYHDERVGICWDTGHANLNYFDQERALKYLGKRVKALHIHDNHRNLMDEHLSPYLGDIDWRKIMRTLVEIGYEGDLTYEAGQVGKHAPAGDFQNIYLRMVYENACAMRNVYQEECDNR